MNEYNFFLEADDDEKEKKNKTKNEEDSSTDNDYIDTDDDDKEKKDDKKKDDEDEEPTDNEYIDTDDTDDDIDSNDDKDADDIGTTDNDYIGDSDSDDFEKEPTTDNDYLGDSPDDFETDASVNGENTGMLSKLAYACVVAANNLRHVHLMCSGRKFDEIHRVSGDLSEMIYYWFDQIAEIALEDESCEIDNCSNAAKYVPEFHQETENNYDFVSGFTAISETLRILMDIMKSTYDACSDRTDIQSFLDDKFRRLSKEYNFMVKRKLKGSGGGDTVEESFVVTNNNFF